jgi:SAM-dependent methyltransferase
MSGQPATSFDLDPEFYAQLIDFDERLAREGPFLQQHLDHAPGKRVLELACGTGHHAVALTEWGYDVTATDASPPMIDYCERTHGEAPQRRWTGLDLEQLDRLPDQFDAIICLGNSLALLSDEAKVDDVLTQIAAHLAPGGVCIMQVLNLYRLPDGELVWQRVRAMTLHGRDYLIVKGIHRCGDCGWVNIVQLDQAALSDLSQCRSTPLLGLAPTELEPAATEAGLTDVQFFGNYAGAPFDIATSGDLIMVARRPAS